MPVTTAILGSGVLGAGASLVGGGKGASAATQAAKIQAQAAQQATQVQAAEFQQIQNLLSPYITAGSRAEQALLPQVTGGALGSFAPIQSWNPTQAGLAATPGYQFTLGQGLQATQNQLAAQGLGRSGAAVMGAANYAEGLASTTYNQQFQNYLQQQQLQLASNQQLLGAYQGLIGTGVGAAGGQANIGSQTAAGIGSTLTSGAAASAGGIVGAANAAINALGGVSGAGSNTALLLALNNAGIFAPQNATPAINTQSTGLPF